MFASLRFRRVRHKAEPGQRRTLRERGAAALEFALVAPLFFLVVFGGIEIGYMFRSHLTIQDTARVAARVASVERSSDDADLEIIKLIERRASSLNGDVQRIVIFSADTLNSELDPTSPCRTGTTNNQGEKCNVYADIDGDLGALVAELEGHLSNPLTAPTPGIQSSDRGPWDNIGIYIEYDYNYVTGFFDSITLDTQAIEVIELDI